MNQLFLENETDIAFPFDEKEVASAVISAVLEEERCPYDVQINLLITDEDGIREFNLNYRDTDRETDVLSFPNVDYESPSDFSGIENRRADYFDPDSGELYLGDIILCAPKVVEQANEFNHSLKREFAFLIAHSMLHLCGYDHMDEEERAGMEEKQRLILTKVKITRED